MNYRHVTLLLFVFFQAFAKWSPAQTTADFQVAAGEEHYVLILLSEIWADTKEIAGEVAKYNQSLPSGKPAKMQLYRIPFLSQQAVITLSGFPNQQAAEKYCQKLLQENPDFLQMQIVTHLWPIALSNFNEMLRHQSAEGYQAFLEKYYAFFR